MLNIKNQAMVSLLCMQMTSCSGFPVSQNSTIYQSPLAQQNTASFTISKPIDQSLMSQLNIGSLQQPFGIKVDKTNIDQVKHLLNSEWVQEEDSLSKAVVFFAGLKLPTKHLTKIIYKNQTTESTMVLWFDNQKIIQRITYINHDKDNFAEFSEILDNQSLTKGINSAFGEDYHKSFFGIFDSTNTVEWITQHNSYYNVDLEILLHGYEAGLGMPNQQLLDRYGIDSQAINNLDNYYLELDPKDYKDIIWLQQQPHEGQSLTIVSKKYLDIFEQTLCKATWNVKMSLESKNNILKTLKRSCDSKL